MPDFRLAEGKDFDVLYDIWMQDHINPFMSFEQISKQEFRSIFNSLHDSSDIYVLEENNQVLAVRRVVYGVGNYEHVAYFASFGVHKDYLGKGYGKLFYDFLIEMLRNKKPHITRIELTQETDNKVALTLAKKNSFKIEVISPESMLRITGTHKDKWYVGSNFLAMLLNPEIEKESKVLGSYVPKLPAFIPLNDIDVAKLNIKKIGEKIYCHYDDQLQAVCDLTNGIRRSQHMQFWLITIQSNCNQAVIKYFLRLQAIESSFGYKKIEIVISDNLLLDNVEQLGFFYRGQKVASRKIGDNYYNEACVDLSFFNIADAKNVLSKKEPKDEYRFSRILASLTKCHGAIVQAVQQSKIDEYGRLYLENLVFQMIREEFNELRFYTEATAPWSQLIEQLPVELSLKGIYEELAQLINPQFLSNNRSLSSITPQLIK